MWVDLFKCLSEIGEKNAVKVGGVIQKALYLEVVKLRLPEDIEERLSGVQGTHKSRAKRGISRPVKNTVTGIGQT